MEVDKILQEISKYTTTEEDIFSFLVQESKKYSTLSFLKHLLLSIVDCDKFAFLISAFYHLEYGEDTITEISLCYHGREIKKTKKELLLERKEKLKKVVNAFTHGDSASLKEILAYSESISSFLSIYHEKIEKECAKKLVVYEDNLQKFTIYDEKLLSLRKNKKDAQKGLKKKVPLVLSEKKILKNGEEKVVTKTYKFFKTFAYQKYAMKLDSKIEALKKEKASFQEKESMLLEEIEALFSSLKGRLFWESIVKKYEYYNRSVPLQEIIKTILLVGETYKELVHDFFICFQVIQEYPKLCGYIKNGNVLPFVGKKIRESYVNSSGESWDVQIRKVDVPKPKDSPYRVYGYLELPKKIEELSKVFLEILKEKDSISFVKKCANFYLDLLIVQPYQIGNEKTIRILLSLMFLTHNIILPSTFSILDKMSYEDILYKTYGDMEAELLMRYSLICPNIEK